MFVFFVILFMLMVIYFSTKSKEGFDTYSKSPSHKVNLPMNVVPPAISAPPARNMNEDDAKPSDLPGGLPVAPYNQIANSSPLPYQDPTLIKAKRQEILNTLEDLKGFLAFEAQEISEMSDPNIQLPLTTARADFKRLQDDAYLLQRNPGIQPMLTESHLNEIQANLSHLQRTVRLIGTAGPIQGPIYEFTDNISAKNIHEGFTDPVMASMMSNIPDTPSSSGGAIATLEDLQHFVTRVSAEIIRLSASGTTDPIINARVNALTQIKSDIENVIEKVQSGALMSTEIPVMKADIDKALPILGKPNEPLPQILQSMNLPAGLANILPSGVANDPESKNIINSLIDKYAEDVVKGLSASAAFSVKYTSPREAESSSKTDKDMFNEIFNNTFNLNGGTMHTKKQMSTVDKTGFPSFDDLNNISGAAFRLHGTPNDVTDVFAENPTEDGRGPAQFDWKERAKQIEDQVKKRGLNPNDFGIMPRDAKVSSDFSWRGYARMICNRLQTTMDPGLPETCGCPPTSWKGWHTANY
jgi:hypothetical protein